MASKRRSLRFAIAALAGLVVVAGIGSIAARQIRSPAQIAADTAAPAAPAITAPVERRALATEVIVRGTVRYGTPQEVVLPASGLKTSTQLISRVPKPDARLGEGDTAQRRGHRRRRTGRRATRLDYLHLLSQPRAHHRPVPR